MWIIWIFIYSKDTQVAKTICFFVIEAMVSFVCWAQPELGAVETRQRVVHSRAGEERDNRNNNNTVERVWRETTYKIV